MAIQYNSNFDETIPFSDVCIRFNLAATAAQTYTIPGIATNKYQALFAYNATSNVFVGYNVGATSPASGTQETSGRVEFRPKKRYVQGGDVLSLITPDTNSYVGLSLRALPGS